jgi:hypothetical protein
MHGTKDWVVVLFKVCWDTGMERESIQQPKQCIRGVQLLAKQQRASRAFQAWDGYRAHIAISGWTWYFAFFDKIWQRCLISFRRLQLSMAVMYFVL